MKQLSVIVPVYNVEEYICDCVESIYRQGLSEEVFEVILVNDGTQDQSFAKIDNVIRSHSNILVVEQDNQGLSVARNTGLQSASGQYVLFLDSDDLLIDSMLKKILDKAVNSSSDLVVANFVKMTNDEIACGSIMLKTGEPIEYKTGKDLFLQSFNPQQCYVWRTLYKKEFLDRNNLRFIPDIFFEDVPFTVGCYLTANKCILFPHVFYIYRQRPNSIVSSINMKKLKDMNSVIAFLWNYKENHIFSTAINRQLMNTLFSTFSISIWYVIHDKNLYDQRKDYIKDLKAKVPKIRFTNGIKQRMVSLMFNFFPSFYIWVRLKIRSI